MNMVDHLRFLVLPQRLQNSQSRKRYQTTRASEKFIGNLKGFEDLPIDIALEVSIRFKYQIIVTLELLIIFLAQIARYLNPYHLLQISRLSKQFRSIFASRSARFIWRAAFRDLYSKCPAHLNELQLASLLYDDCCMVFQHLSLFIQHKLMYHSCSIFQACGRNVRCKVYSSLYLRLCRSCQSVK